ncbi:hypothetical protein GCM10017779_31190 [Streptomyces capillispiralis]|uniref:Uncharacterized protein n=1 Tax=Streptomyces capillispiralis TaxID=68182 RepID=A0A561TJU3_9ACTN|nr:hypothetical protein FHX78_114421 [Streptomyces capillispiralis]GHH92662.1 hypothetical protein GCM10017779_31190 [Streptomyces capillispiralis]
MALSGPLPSVLTEARVCPSGLKERLPTIAVWPVSRAPDRGRRGSDTSHSATVPSLSPVARVAASGEKATVWTLWRLCMCRSALATGRAGSATSPSRTRLSLPAAARLWPSGLNSTRCGDRKTGRTVT